MVRNYKKKKPETSYTLVDIENAVLDVSNRNKTYREAEQHYGIPISVIFHRIKGRKVPLTRKGPGRSTALPQEIERNIVNCLLARSRMGYPCTKIELRSLVGEYVKINNIETPFKNDMPGEDWYLAFMKRNPEVSLKKPELLQKCRKTARDPYIVYDFYKKLQEVVQESDLQGEEKYCLIFNADETAFNSDPSKIKAIGEKGKCLSRISGGSGRENTTVLACISADGAYLPPLIVFKGKAVQPRWISDKAYPGTLYGVTKNGWMEETTFYNWFVKLFIPHVNNIRISNNLENQIALLMYDGHNSHISVRIVEAAIDNNIHLMKFPSHLTDRIQPLDKCVFGPLKIRWDRLLIDWGKSQVGISDGRLKKNKFVELLAMAWERGMIKSNIKSGFLTTGICPVDASRFPKDYFDPIVLQKYENQQQVSFVNQPNTVDVAAADPNDAEQIEKTPAEIVEIFSKQLRQSTGITSEASTSKTDKPVIPRLKQNSYGEILTTEEVLTRLREAEEKKKEKSASVGKRAKITKVKGLNKKSRMNRSESTDKEELIATTEILTAESSDGETFEDIIEEENRLEVNYESPKWESIKPNVFVLVKFLGGPRKSVSFKYVCMVQSADDDDGEITVQGLTVLNSKGCEFVVKENDISTVNFDSILAILPTPEVKQINRKLVYVFPGAVDVFELR